MLEEIFQVSRSLHTISNSIRFPCARVFIRCEHCAYVCIFKCVRGYGCVFMRLYIFYIRIHLSLVRYTILNRVNDLLGFLCFNTHITLLYIYTKLCQKRKKQFIRNVGRRERERVQMLNERERDEKPNKKSNKREKSVYVYNTIRNLTNKSETQTRNGKPSW